MIAAEHVFITALAAAFILSALKRLGKPEPRKFRDGEAYHWPDWMKKDDE